MTVGLIWIMLDLSSLLPTIPSTVQSGSTKPGDFLNRDTVTEAEVTSFLDDGGSRILEATYGRFISWVERWNTS